MTDNEREDRALIRINASGDTSGDQFRQSDNQVVGNGGDASAAAAKKKKFLIRGLIGAGILVVVVLAIVLPIVLTGKSGGTDPVNPNPPPEPPFSNDTQYNPYNIEKMDVEDGESVIRGHMYAREPYKAVTHAKALQNLLSGLSTISSPHNITTLPQHFPEGPNNRFITNLTFEFYLQNSKTGILTITDQNSSRYSIVDSVVNKGYQDTTMRLDMLGFKLFYEPFGFEFSDIRDPTNIFVDTRNSSLVFMDKFIQMDFQLPSQRIFGFGERVREFQLGEGTWTMWAKGQNAPYDDGLGGKNAYGVHPFILVQGKKKGDFFGMAFRNSNAQSPIIKYNSADGATLSYITTGGQLEIYVFAHGTAKDIIQQYMNTFGTPNLPPFWSLGWHQASYAYKTQDDVQYMIDKYASENFPLDNVWLDIPYLNKYEDFTVDKKAFPTLKDMADTLHDNRQQLVVIIDGGISADNEASKYYRLAFELDALIKSSIHPDNNYHGAVVQKVWPNHTVFLDWFYHESATVWNAGLKDLYAQVPYDGLWLDMNEPTGFCSGECYDGMPLNTKRNLQEQSSFAEDPRLGWFKSYSNQDKMSTYDLPFIPGFYYGGNLDNMTLSLNATHKDGSLEYDVHSLYGHMMVEKTFNFLTDENNFWHYDFRPFILSRSTFMGSGKYTAHWTGDNYRTWDYMKYSIAGIMNMQMFGVPMVGADICGFHGEEFDSEMCGRWIQLSTFYPLARMHYANDSKPSEPYQLEGNWKNIARKSMYDRYQYLRLMYTCMFEASKFGTTCFDPLFYHFPEDDQTLKNTEESFIFGNALKVSPILKAGVKDTDTYDSYFPKGKWASMIDRTTVEGGKVVQLKPQETVNVHLMPGRLIPFQDNSKLTYKNVHELIGQPIKIVANLDENDVAEGTLFVDRGFNITEIDKGEFEYYKLTIQANTLQKTLAEGTHASRKGHFDGMMIMNAKAHGLDKVDFACYYTHYFDIIQMNLNYDEQTDSLHIFPLEPIYFHIFRQVNFGTKGFDLNLCDEKTYQHHIKGGLIPDQLNSDKVSFVLQPDAERVEEKYDLNVDMQTIDSKIVNIKWTLTEAYKDYDYTPFEVPKDVVNVTKSSTLYNVSNFARMVDKPFKVEIFNPTTQNTMVNLRQILFGKYLNHFGLTLFTQKDDKFHGVMGLGDRTLENLFYEDGVYSTWSRDSGLPLDNGRPSGKNAYGSQPFMMFQHDDKTWVGIFTNLASAQDWYIKNNKAAGTIDVDLVAAGGIADIYFIIESSPIGVLSEYYTIIGNPVLIPQWALGWHQCRWGYKTTDDLRAVVKGYESNNIPLEVMWSDIDYLYDYRDFTYDHTRFDDLPAFIGEIHRKRIKYIPIIDAGIAAREPGTYPAYDDGIAEDIFIKINDQPFVGTVWPKDAVFPDFFNPKTTPWWQKQIDYLYKDIAFDGLWEDMNEASNFCNGICYQDQKPAKKQLKYYLKYTPTGRSLEEKSISLDAVHYQGIKEIDVHNLYGTMQVKATHEWFQKQNKRTMIIERSSSAGLGKYGSRWLGDNTATPAAMGQSVIGIMMMNIFGIPLVGADICGLWGNTTPELCARWHVVGSFYPFSRNHNDYKSFPQEPYTEVFQEEYEPGVTYTSIMRMAIRNKYHLIKYYYTQLYLMSTQGSRPFYNPLFFEYPNDINAYKDQKYNIMLGPSLKLSVLSDQVGRNFTNFYFPAGTWCNIYDYSEKCFQSIGATQQRRTKAYDFYVHLREGHIVPLQNATALNVSRIYTLMQAPVDFHILGQVQTQPDVDWVASGTFINDNGTVLDIEGNYNKYDIEATYSTVNEQQKMLIQFKTKSAYNYKQAGSNCTAVNMNDFIGNIIIHNAKQSKCSGEYFVTAYYVNDESEQWGAFKSNDDIDKLVITPPADSDAGCISSLSYIKIIKTK